MKKHKILLTLTLLLTSISFAIPKGPCNKKEKVCWEEPTPGPFAFSYPKDMNLSCPQDFYVKGEFLLMQVKEEGLDKYFALLQQTSSTSKVKIDGKEIIVGLGVHDSSASLIPYVQKTSEQFVLVSTGTWSICMNYFKNMHYIWKKKSIWLK